MPQDESYSPEPSSLLSGLDPDTLDNLRRSQKAYEELGVKMSLEAVAAFEIEDVDPSLGL